MQNSEPHRWLYAVDEFVKNEVTPIVGKKRIKVALIDDGIDISQFNDEDVWVPGWPLEGPTSKEGPWYYSTQGHGTHMAKMIRRVCPHVQLFVAKLGNAADFKAADRAAKVCSPCLSFFLCRC